MNKILLTIQNSSYSFSFSNRSIFSEIGPCEFCGEEFRLKTALILHKLNQHKLREKKLKASKIIALKSAIEILYSSDSECEYEICLKINRIPKKQSDALDQGRSLDHDGIDLDIESNNEMNDNDFVDKHSHFTQSDNENEQTMVDFEEQTSGESKPFCHICYKDFASNNTRNVHMKRVHKLNDYLRDERANLKRFQCYLCQKLYGTFYSLRCHLKRMHPIVRAKNDEANIGAISSQAKIPCKGDRHCTHCDKIFSCHLDYRHHLEKLKKGKRFFCKHCFTPFDSKVSILKHRQNNVACRTVPKSKTFLCNFCGKHFARQNTLNVHLKSHLNDKPHRCEYCDRGFVTAAQMRQHTNIHTGLRPFVCPIDTCKKSFSANSALYQHQTNVHAPRTLKCPHCDKMFSKKEHRE